MHSPELSGNQEQLVDLPLFHLLFFNFTINVLLCLPDRAETDSQEKGRDLAAFKYIM